MADTNTLTAADPSAQTDPLFALDITLEEARESIEGRPEFVEKEEDDYIVFNYKYCNHRTFPDPNEAKDPRTRRLLQIRRLGSFLSTKPHKDEYGI